MKEKNLVRISLFYALLFLIFGFAAIPFITYVWAVSAALSWGTVPGPSIGLMAVFFILFVLFFGWTSYTIWKKVIHAKILGLMSSIICLLFFSWPVAVFFSILLGPSVLLYLLEILVFLPFVLGFVIFLIGIYFFGFHKEYRKIFSGEAW